MNKALMNEALPIALSDVAYYYGKGSLKKQILFGVDAQVGAGEIVILTGPSGSGKTTLLTLIGALRSAQEGSVQVLGRELNNARERTLIKTRRQIGYVFQSHNLLESLTISQNVQMSLRFNRGKGINARRQIREVLERVGLGEFAGKYPRSLSGGQKQRAGIARALVNKPRIVLADEPTASLDRKSGRDVVNLLQELARQDGTAVVLVTHDNRILDVADRILHLEDGHMKSLTEAVSEDTSRMLNLLSRHDPGAASYLASFSFALARVAFADNEVTEEERQAMQRILKDVANLESSEVDFIMELSMMQRLAQNQMANRAPGGFGADRARHFIESLYEIARADGHVSAEEVTEIRSIAAEFGIAHP